MPTGNLKTFAKPCTKQSHHAKRRLAGNGTGVLCFRRLNDIGDPHPWQPRRGDLP